MTLTQNVLAEHEHLIAQFKTLLLATVNAQGEPQASYAPYVREGQDFYIYVSDLAAHTANLLQHGKASVLFIEDESQSKNLFARKRSTLQCQAEEIARNSAHYNTILALFRTQFGNTIDVLQSLPDFHLIRLSPQQAGHVGGFARAFSLEGKDLHVVQPIDAERLANAKNNPSS